MWTIGAVCSGSTLFAAILNLSVTLGNYLQQTISADDIFRCIFLLGALRANFSPAIDNIKLRTCVVCVLSVNKRVYSLDTDQAQQNVGPDLDPNCLTVQTNNIHE